MAAENVVVVAEVQVTDGGAGQGLSTDAVRAAAWARHREERLLSQQPQKSQSGVPGAKFLHRHWRRASNNVPVFLDTHSNRLGGTVGLTFIIAPPQLVGHASESVRACVPPMMSRDISTSDTIVACGQPVACHGEAILGPLTLHCDGSIAGQVWGAGAALGRHLLLTTLPERPEVIEIGSGTGVAGLAAAAAGATSVILTDLPEGVPRLKDMIQRNEAALQSTEVTAAALEWGDEGAARTLCADGVDLVLAADVLYSGEPAVHEALRATFVALAKPRDALILHAYEERWPKIVQMWRASLSDPRCGLRVVQETVLDAPWMRPDGEYSGFRERRMILQTLRLTEDCLFS